LDGVSRSPLRNASVYINNTTRGTITDDKGQFQLSSLSPGAYEIVVTFIAFDPLVYPIRLTDSDYRIEFLLDRKEQELRPVLILPGDTRKRYLDLFRKNLLGFTQTAQSCKIRNLDEVRFSAGNRKGDIVAYSDQELVIDNPYLGYTIYFQLTDFYLNEGLHAAHFFGYTRFEDWDREGSVKRKWKDRRKKVYTGSSQHFFRSLVQNNLVKDGFRVEDIQKMPDQRTGQATASATDPIVSQVMDQRVSSAPMLAIAVRADSLLKPYADTGYRVYELVFHEQLRIYYPANTFLKQEVARVSLLTDQPAIGTISGVRLRNRPVLVDYRGRLVTPMNIYSDGIWAWERMANMLPEDYEPD
jgi:hypothetical protein